VVEDCRDLCDALVQALNEAGHTVVGAPDGEEALRLARNATYDVFVLDIMLPKVDGLTVLRTLRSTGSLARVLMMTARDAALDRSICLQLGADDFLTKPFEFSQFLAMVQRLSGEAKARSSPT
jgi:DNA-binding response OmpR family regulator